MSCLGGTPKDPRVWFRYRGDDYEQVPGRICTRTNPRTSRDKCSSCPAFRGVRWDGTINNGMGPDGYPIGLNASEHQQYQTALEATLIDDDFDLLSLFRSRMEREVTGSPGSYRVGRGPGQRVLMMIGDPAACAVHASRQRAYRAAHPGLDKRKRKRDRAAYMREYRAQRKAEA